MTGSRIVVVGGAGTIGSAVVTEMSTDHEVVVAGRTSDLSVDLADLDSLRAFTAVLQGGAPLEASCDASACDVSHSSAWPSRTTLDVTSAAGACRCRRVARRAQARATERELLWQSEWRAFD